MIQHYLHQIRSLQRARITGEGENLVPTLFEVDEAHQYFKRYSNDEMSREIERELETHIKLSRSLKVATLLASQLGSELHPAANRLATVKMILRSDRTEIRALGIPLTDNELAAVEGFTPGMAQLRDGYRIKVPVYTRIPMSPAQVRGQT
jgi:DNA helicase HerA-like ATPase